MPNMHFYSDILIQKNIHRESVIWQDLQKMCNILYIYPFKIRLLVFMMVLSFLFNVQAQDGAGETMPELPQHVRPSKGVVIVVLSIMISISILILAYVRFVRTSPLELLHRNGHLQNFHGLTRSRSRLSGIDRKVIETLPFFKFSSLKGSKEGLECSVCLSKFEDTESLRLLPKCKHAFHMNCIDKWLESHSSCPLCRYKVDPRDMKNFTYSISSRFLRVPSNLTEEPTLDIFVQREPSHRGSSGFDIGSSFWDVGKRNKELLIDEEGNSSGTNWKHVHKLNHKIVISDVVTRSRWSDLNSSDLLCLNSEMLNDMSSRRFFPLESANSERFHRSSSLPSTFNEEENSFILINPADKRSMSEISHVPRFAEINKQNRIKESVASSGNNGREERLRRIWLQIAQRTVQWFARRERNSGELEHVRLASKV